eukprot:4961328-Amphidinium_carterae.1
MSFPSAVVFLSNGLILQIGTNNNNNNNNDNNNNNKSCITILKSGEPYTPLARKTLVTAVGILLLANTQRHTDTCALGAQPVHLDDDVELAPDPGHGDLCHRLAESDAPPTTRIRVPRSIVLISQQ